jgi:hypothetical protein
MAYNPAMSPESTEVPYVISFTSPVISTRCAWAQVPPGGFLYPDDPFIDRETTNVFDENTRLRAAFGLVFVDDVYDGVVLVHSDDVAPYVHVVVTRDPGYWFEHGFTEIGTTEQGFALWNLDDFQRRVDAKFPGSDFPGEDIIEISLGAGTWMWTKRFGTLEGILLDETGTRDLFQEVVNWNGDPCVVIPMLVDSRPEIYRTDIRAMEFGPDASPRRDGESYVSHFRSLVKAVGPVVLDDSTVIQVLADLFFASSDPTPWSPGGEPMVTDINRTGSGPDTYIKRLPGLSYDHNIRIHELSSTNEHAGHTYMCRALRVIDGAPISDRWRSLLVTLCVSVIGDGIMTETFFTARTPGHETGIVTEVYDIYLALISAPGRDPDVMARIESMEEIHARNHADWVIRRDQGAVRLRARLAEMRVSKESE